MSTQKKSFKETLNLPKTDFSIRANAKQTEPAIRQRWFEGELYRKTYEHAGQDKTFILHDGPPYANGNIHMGTAFNKVLKDTINKYKRMTGHYVPYKPGWDCHGLPIEFKVLQEMGITRKDQEVDPSALKKACRETAQTWIDVQRSEFVELGVLADWSAPYSTMSYGYEAQIVRSFASFVKKGFIRRQLKTVPWCFSCKTALAAAEIEHKERKDPSCYILFGIADEIMQEIFADVMKQRPSLQAHFLVWTTTPWTIPLNRAVVLNPDAEYVLLEGKEENQAFIVGAKRADDICQMLEIEKKVLATFKSEIFKGQYALHPLVKDLTVSVLHDNAVLTSDGTACMHMAPGCGPEDYLIARKNDIEVYSPLAADGTYSDAILPKELVGMSITDGQIWVMRALKERGALLHKTSLRHSYPHCWRCRNGLMFRATEQWFCNLSHNDLTGKAMSATDAVQFMPSTGSTRLRSTIESRSEWCISRQRYWGVPIIALLCNECDAPYLDASFIESVADKIAQKGIEFWDAVSLASLRKEGILSGSLACGACGNDAYDHFRKETDILDVWFDSGVSHYAVLDRVEELSSPADLYLEGSDQHRGWFQSSLLTSMVLKERPPTKAILTHGYVVDGDGRKMSKSLGNTVAPQEVMQKYSVDILRLWVASVDYASDMVLSDTLLKNVAEVYRKIRNTCRFLLSNIYDFDSTRDMVEIENLRAIDQYALARLHEVAQKIDDAYEHYQTQTVYQTLGAYCASELSSFFLDIMKDRLYCDKADGHSRRSAQTACYIILDTLVRRMAPILSYLAEEVSDHYMVDKEKSIHLHQWIATVPVWDFLAKKSIDAAKIHVQLPTPQSARLDISPVARSAQWQMLEMLRDCVLKSLEELRHQESIKHSLEAQLHVYIDSGSPEGKTLQSFLGGLAPAEDATSFLKEFCIVSQVSIHKDPSSLEATALPWAYIMVQPAQGDKCPRCWQFDTAAHEDGLCQRCQPLV